MAREPSDVAVGIALAALALTLVLTVSGPRDATKEAAFRPPLSDTKTVASRSRPIFRPGPLVCRCRRLQTAYSRRRKAPVATRATNAPARIRPPSDLRRSQLRNPVRTGSSQSRQRCRGPPGWLLTLTSWPSHHLQSGSSKFAATPSRRSLFAFGLRCRLRSRRRVGDVEARMEVIADGF